MRGPISRSLISNIRRQTSTQYYRPLSRITTIAHLQRDHLHSTQCRSYTSKPQKKQELHALTAKLVSTPSRLFKLILPIPAIKEDGKPENDPDGDEYHSDPPSALDRGRPKDDQHPQHLALLIHPHQPLSHLAHLIQGQLPTLKSGRVPTVSFYRPVDTPPPREEVVVPQGDEVIRSGGPGGGLAKPPSSAQGMSEDADENSMVLWSGSTEIGDFVRDAAAGHEDEAASTEGGFVIDIEGTVDKSGVWVSVPSFNDRTTFLRRRYARISGEIESQMGIKEKCDGLAHRSAQRVAMTGFGGLITWWGLVYVLTFQTTLGWEVMEPVTYLVGLSTVMIGYLWFLYNNREVSYRSVLHATISRRQMALYKAHGFDIDRWQDLLEEGRELRREIQNVAGEYGVRWTGKDETANASGAMSKEDREVKGKVEEVLAKDDDDDEEDDGEKDVTKENKEDKPKDKKSKKKKQKDD